MEASHIKKLPIKTQSHEVQAQGELDLGISCEAEIQGIGMGVLNDGTPFLHQRGLAALCGVMNAHIGTISSDWNEEHEKPRIKTIKSLLAKRGIFIDSPHIATKQGGTTIYAYSDNVCLAILEYYAFEAGTNCRDDAKENFRTLAGLGLREFIYTQVGYDPNQSVPIEWKQFHDRVSLTYNVVPHGFFSVFKEIADMIVTLGQNGLHIDSTFLPDGSVGQVWAKHWKEQNLALLYGERQKFEHNYPEYFPQSASNPQDAWCYPEEALGTFRKWMRETYIGEGKFKKYIETKVRQKALPTSFAQLAIEAYNTEK